MKKCRKCGVEKSLTEFYAHNNCKDGVYPRCKECSRAATREYHCTHRAEHYARNKRYYEKSQAHVRALNRKYAEKPSAKERKRAAHLRLRYGEDFNYDALLLSQGGVCAACGEPPKTGRFDVDHDHASGEVRALLCHRCNIWIGYEEKNSELTDRIHEYIEHWKKRRLKIAD